MSLALSMQNDLAIGGQLTGTGWQLPGDLSQETWERAGELLAKVEQSKQWWLGDWWNAGQNEGWGDGREACERIGFEYQTAQNCGSICRTFEFSRRRENLTFSHHAEVSAIPDASVQERMLDWCGEPLREGKKAPRSTRELREQVRAYLDEQGWSKEDRKRRDAVRRGLSIVANKKTDEKLIRWAQFEGLAVSVDRGSDWGNPFILPADGDRDTCCESYAVYLSLKPSLLKRISELKGKVLLCWCHPERCHADHLARLANEQKG